MSENHHDNDKTQTHILLIKDTTVGHYRIVEKIGAGGMGEVYLAEDTELDRKVALKFLSHQLCQDEECRARFKREAQAAAKLNHPNIITIHEVNEYMGRPFFAMEYIEGRSLREFISENGITVDFAVDVALQLCEGLEKAHDEGIIHRDVKPSNIIIDADGRARLVDFGLATVRHDDRITKTGSTLGTIGYMSPEHIKGKKVDRRSDLFSLGVVLYEMIAGRRPFEGENEAATLSAIVSDTPEPLSRYKSGIPESLQRIVSKLLEKDPAYRYQSAAGIMPDLKKLASRQVVSDRPAGWRNRYLVIAAAVILLAIAGYWLVTEFIAGPSTKPEPEMKMLAVLPFENLGSEEDEYFADGITDEIISRLAGLHGLGVISRTSTLQYKGTTKNLREIGNELEVEYILEGTIRWDKSGEASRVRINPQLIRVADDVHLWADRYDAIIDDIFAVQANIATEVVNALDVALLESERRSLTEQPTENTEAYDYYLRGREFITDKEKDLRNAVLMFEKAIELEPDFALAHAVLCFTHIQIYWWYFDRSEQRLKAARDAIDRALEIAPENPEVRGTLGWYYYHGHLDYDRALEEFAVLREKQPANAQAIYCIALIERRQSKWESAVKNFRTALKLNPRCVTFCWEFGNTLSDLRRFEEAEDFYNRAIDLRPDLESSFTRKSANQIYWKGDIDTARRILEDALQRNERSPRLTGHEIQLDIMAGDYNRALGLMTDPGAVVGFAAADTAYYYNLKGDIYRYMQRTDLMEGCYDSARVILEGVVQTDYDDPMYHSYLSWAYAGLGRGQESIHEGKLAVELLPVSKDAIDGAVLIEDLAKTYAIVGKYDLAIDQLEYLLSIPSAVSAPYLRIWPDFAPLRDHPRFQALLAKYDTVN